MRVCANEGIWDAFSGFSSPCVDWNQRVFDSAVRESTRHRVEILTKLPRAAISERKNHLRRKLLDRIDRASLQHFVPDLWMGALPNTLTGECNGELWEALTSVILHFVDVGGSEADQIDMPRPVQIRYKELILPRCQSAGYEYNSEMGTLKVQCNDVPAFFLYDLKCGCLVESENCRSVKLFEINDWLDVIDAAFYQESINGAPKSRSEVIEAQKSYQDDLKATFTLLSELNWPFLEWVRRTVRHLIPMLAVGWRSMSCSSDHLLSAVAMTHHHEPTKLAEMLIHEAAHQYKNLLTKIGPIDDGSDQRLFYSSARGADRPIAAIVVAFHAFANVELFYRDVFESFPKFRNLAADELADVSKTVDQLGAIVEGNTSLTGIGQALVHPLLKAISVFR